MIIYKDKNSLHFEFKNEVISRLKAINKPIIIFGTGTQAQRYINYFNIEADYFLDNNPLKTGTLFHNKQVFLPQHAIEDKGKSIILIASEAHLEISAQLIEMGFEIDKDVYEVLHFFSLLHEEAAMDMAEGDNYKYQADNGARILFDITTTTTLSGVSGIARVAYNLIPEVVKQNNLTPVKQIGSIFIEPTDWLSKSEIISKPRCKKIQLSENDIWLLLDMHSEIVPRFSEEDIINAKVKGVKIINCVHDIIPISNPEICPVTVQNTFKKMLDRILKYSDGVITVSKSSADEIINYIEKNNINFGRKFSVGWFHVGCRLTRIKSEAAVPPNIKPIFNKKTFLMVGTIEPRKCHYIALDAFEKLWDAGYDYNLLIAGKIGWKVGAFMERLKNHKMLNKSLFFLETPPDNELEYCYKNSSALIFASMAEGYGSPIIEAAQFSLPLILSDIPVFREVAGANATYFNVGDSNSLKNRIIEWNNLDKDNPQLKSNEIYAQTPEECLERIFNVVKYNNWYKEFR